MKKTLILAILLTLSGCTTRIIVEEKPCGNVTFGEYSEPRATLEYRAPQVYPYKRGYCTANIPPTCFWQNLPSMSLTPSNSIVFLDGSSVVATEKEKE